jgi:hypothetical protein
LRRLLASNEADLLGPSNQQQWQKIDRLFRYKPDLTKLMAATIENFCDNKCYDVRDKVYGLRSLLPGGIRDKILVDYGKSVEEVFLDAVRAVARHIDDEEERVQAECLHVAMQYAQPGEEINLAEFQYHECDVNALYHLCTAMLGIEAGEEDVLEYWRRWEWFQREQEYTYGSWMIAWFTRRVVYPTNRG